jgi:hypothetical protein
LGLHGGPKYELSLQHTPKPIRQNLSKHKYNKILRVCGESNISKRKKGFRIALNPFKYSVDYSDLDYPFEAYL